MSLRIINRNLDCTLKWQIADKLHPTNQSTSDLYNSEEKVYHEFLQIISDATKEVNEITKLLAIFTKVNGGGTMKTLKRKVTQVGERLMVALDKDWCREHSIKKGTEVDVVVIPQGFCILPPKERDNGIEF